MNRKTKRRKHTTNASAFSLIEVLVASAILIIIVLILSTAFRQGTLAWDSGITRADGSAQARALIGAIANELRAAGTNANVIAGTPGTIKDYWVIKEGRNKSPASGIPPGTYPPRIDELINSALAAADADGNYSMKVSITPGTCVTNNRYSSATIEVRLSGKNFGSGISGLSTGGDKNNEKQWIKEH